MGGMLHGVKRNIAQRIYKFVKFWAIDYDERQSTLLDTYRRLGVQIGKNAVIYCTTLDPLYPYLITIGNDVTITHATILVHDDSSISFTGRQRVAPVTIGDNVFVGWQSIILPGVNIGSNVIIGAGSVVSRDVPNDVVVAGNPARIVRTIDEFTQKVRMSSSLIDLEIGSRYVTEHEIKQLDNLVRSRFQRDGEQLTSAATRATVFDTRAERL
jgi:maltose O-acetyltransferase